jgi:hypothetical protein
MPARTIDTTAVRPHGSAWIVPSRTQTGVEYVIRTLADGTRQCNCPAAMHGRNCWHLESVQQYAARNERCRTRPTLEEGLALIMAPRRAS